MAKRGDAYRAEAEAALNRTSIFGFGKSKKYDDASKAFKMAGNAYKLDKNWQSAGESFKRASECFYQIEDEIEGINCIVEAANAYRNIDQAEAVACFLIAVDKYNEKGRFGQSAKIHKDIAEMYEAGNNKEQAIVHYRQAADLYTTDNKKTSASPCLLKVASLLSSNDQYTEAANIFESCGRESTESRLGQFSAKGHFLNCLLCHLAAGDVVNARQKLDEFKDVDHTLPASRECGFVEKLIEAMDANNAEDFATACAEFDNITPMDKWKVAVCLRAKRHIMSAGEEDEEGIC